MFLTNANSEVQHGMGSLIKVVRNKKKWEKILLPNMIELFEANRVSHYPPFYDDLILALWDSYKAYGSETLGALYLDDFVIMLMTEIQISA